jgi:putative membrane protein
VSRADELMRLTISYITQLKNEMHDRDKPDIDEETEKLFAKYNIDGNAKISNELLIAIAAGIEHDFESQTSLEKADLMQQINRFYDIQGKAERIKNTPFLMIYSAFTRIIVGFYVALIPIFVGDIDLGGEESKFEFLAIPIMVVISTVFLTINKLANLYGEPFSEKRTAVAIDDICRTIEKNYQEVRRKWNNRSAPAQ